MSKNSGRAQSRAPWMNREDQDWLAREARTFFTSPKSRWFNPTAPSELDREMLWLFDCIERGDDDVDDRINYLGQLVRKENMFSPHRFFIVTPKLKILWQHVAYAAQERERELGKSDSMWQTRINWNRMLGIVGPTWGAPHTISPEWIGPAITLPAAEGLVQPG